MTCSFVASKQASKQRDTFTTINDAMRYDTRTLALFAAAAALRLLLFTVFPSLPALLTSRVEISTPVTSFKRRTLL